MNNSLLVWIRAARPQTLPAAIIPVFVGIALALYDGALAWAPSLVALGCALLIQVGTNFANDYFDFKKGADTDKRIGFERATATGQVTARQMLHATVITMSLAFLLGLYLVWTAGWVILLIGLLSLLCGILYTGGPYPLGYNGLGDLFVFLFFGIVAVMGTYYVNALQWSPESFWASLAVGALSTNILVVNNLRDIEQDRPAGKNTIGVLFGERALQYEYVAMLVIAYLVPFCLMLAFGLSWYVLAPLATLPWATMLVRQIWFFGDRRTLNRTLERTAQFMTLFGLLLGLGIMGG